MIFHVVRFASNVVTFYSIFDGLCIIGIGCDIARAETPSKFVEVISKLRIFFIVSMAIHETENHFLVLTFFTRPPKKFLKNYSVKTIQHLMSVGFIDQFLRYEYLSSRDKRKQNCVQIAYKRIFWCCFKLENANMYSTYHFLCLISSKGK